MVTVKLDEGNWEFHDKGREIQVVPSQFKAEKFADILWENGEISWSQYEQLLVSINEQAKA